MVPMSGSSPASDPAPTIAAVAEQVNGVAPNRKQEVAFSEAMDPSTINNQTFAVTDSAGRVVRGIVHYDPAFDIATFQPSPALQADAQYTAKVTTGVASATGVHLAANYSYRFSTRPTSDKSPIYVLKVDPAANAACVSATAPIVITFSEEPDAATIDANNIVVSGPGGTVTPVQMSMKINTTQVVLTPTSSLPSGVISVTINNVGDLADVMMTAPYSWSFSTACGGGAGSVNAGSTQYQATVLRTADGGSLNGQVTVDSSGNTAIDLRSATAATMYTVQFCPAFDSSHSTISIPPCFNITTLSTDSSGNATAMVKFPRPGNWAGDFYMNDSSGKTIYQTYLLPTLSNETYMATLLRATQTNGGAVTTDSPQEPLSSGTVTYANGTLHFTVNGASPNTGYFTNSSETVYMNSSGTYSLSNFTTDAGGDGSSSFTWGNLSPGGDLFQVEPQAVLHSTTGPAGYIGGFSVPQ